MHVQFRTSPAIASPAKDRREECSTQSIQNSKQEMMDSTQPLTTARAYQPMSTEKKNNDKQESEFLIFDALWLEVVVSWSGAIGLDPAWIILFGAWPLLMVGCLSGFFACSHPPSPQVVIPLLPCGLG